jgi:hypothetical protein
MSAPEVYHQVYQMVKGQLDPSVDESSLERLALFVTGMLKGRSASPAQVAKSLAQLQLSGATAESIERRIRRLENDPEISADLCFHPFARFHLRLGRPQELLLLLDPTTQEDHLVMVTVGIWYRGRALPLAWAIWAGNTPLEGAGFWMRIDRLLGEVERLLPAGVVITLLGDRAFGCPALIDLAVKRNWHYVVRVQGHTLCQDRLGKQCSIQSLVPFPNQRAKLSWRAFKKAGWRAVNVVAYWGKRHQQPLCLVSDRKAGWYLIRLYRQRYPIEATFRDYKSYGWRWEQGQVRDLAHVERLLVGMALATWLALSAGSHQARLILSRPPSGKRRTCPWEGKMSLFQHGLELFQSCLQGVGSLPDRWFLSDWEAPHWKQQLFAHVSHAYVFA